MTEREAMKLALFALDIVKIHYTQSRHINEAITALKERLAQPEQEPVAHQKWCASLTQLLLSMPPQPAPCNCRPPQRTWVGLKDPDFSGKPNTPDFIAGAFFAEAKLKEKNT